MTCCTAAVVVLFGVGVAAAEDRWVTLKGRVIFDGEPPTAVELSVSADQGHCLSKGKLVNEVWVVNKANKGVKNAFVWLADNPDTASGAGLPVHPSFADAARMPVEVDQPVCAFVPRAIAVRQGQPVVFHNSSPVTHNVKWAGSSLKNPGSNETVPSGKSVTVANLKADRMPVNFSCSIHPWMQGWARVFDHPYFAITSEDGAFEIKHAPSGTWRLFVWHEGSGWKGGAAGKKGDAITVRPGGVQDLGALAIKPSS